MVSSFIMATGKIMDRITFINPGKLVFGPGCFQGLLDDLPAGGPKRLFILGIPVLDSFLQERFGTITGAGIAFEIYTGIEQEPSFGNLEQVLEKARRFQAEGVIGIGGGSVLDTAKLLAVLLDGKQGLADIKGMNPIRQRNTYLACVPTTSGTGSEVSPNAIFFDDNTGNKQGVISPFLVPDAAYIDPELTISLPPKETAATGMDALTHCIEAYANRNAHPVVDGIALEGIRRIGSSLKKAFVEGDDLQARSDMSLGSMCGGMCLGPVNTAAVHALSYPLGSIHKVPHGLANAILLPHVLRFNAEVSPERYRDIALALGAEAKNDSMETALEGIRMIEQLMEDCALPVTLSGYGISEGSIDDMVESAMQVKRLLKNNIRDMSSRDAREIYLKAL